MIRLELEAFNGGPPTFAVAAEFDELGGTIGRDAASTLVLPDPEKRISRQHAVIALREGRYVIRDRGSAISIEVNGRPVGAGREVPLGDGDRIAIGPYVLKVTSVPAPVPSSSHPKSHPGGDGAPQDELVSMFGGTGASDPFADLAPRPRAASRVESAPVDVGSARAQAAESPGVIPADFDPFAEPMEPKPSVSPARATEGLGLEPAPPENKPGIDELFGLGPKKGEALFPPGHPLAEPLPGAPGAGIDDLLPRGAPAPTATPVQRDDVEEIHGSMKLPQPATGRKPEPKRGAPVMPPDAVVSWEQGTERETGQVTTVIIPAPEPPRDAHIEPASSEVRSTEPAQASGAPQPISEDALLRAFLEGAGVPDLAMRGPLTPEQMRAIGALLRAATQGTLDLLRSRAVVKSEMRAQMTMIVARENNPLKYSPSVEGALAHLLVPQGRGFMAPTPAMREAYEDLVSHQFGFAAGMRAALAGVLKRFDPVELEKKLTAKTVIDSVVPGHRKARLWDLFTERYEEIARDAEDDFHRLFGHEFVKAYEAQVAKLCRRDEPARD